MLWLGLHFPLLALEVFTACAPDDDRPRVVTDGGRVLLCNRPAATAGIAVGATLATAHSIANPLDHYPCSPERERRRLELLAEALYGFSARVSLAPSDSAGIVLEIGASLRLFGAADVLEQQITALCRNLGHEVRARRAATPLAALILARANASCLGDVPLVQAAVEPERLDADRIERLANMGVQHLAQLLTLPQRGLAQRFGADLVDYLGRITGERPDPRPAIAPAEQFAATVHLLEPLNDKEALAFPMQRLLTDLQHWLVARQLGAEQLVWRFASSAGQQTDMAVRFARARQRREAFLEVTRLKLAEAALPGDVIDVTLEARRLVPWSPPGRGLFRDLPATTDAELEDAGELVDQLRARLGDGACFSLMSVDQHTPEAAWSRVPPLTRQRARRDSVPGRSERPLWLFEPPRTVAREALTLLRGPERVHTGWWLPGGATGGKAPVSVKRKAARSGGEARDYYVARHRSGAECWVFVNPEQRWFLHGYFG